MGQIFSMCCFDCCGQIRSVKMDVRRFKTQTSSSIDNASRKCDIFCCQERQKQEKQRKQSRFKKIKLWIYHNV